MLKNLLQPRTELAGRAQDGSPVSSVARSLRSRLEESKASDSLTLGDRNERLVDQGADAAEVGGDGGLGELDHEDGD